MKKYERPLRDFHMVTQQSGCMKKHYVRAKIWEIFTQKLCDVANVANYVLKFEKTLARNFMDFIANYVLKLRELHGWLPEGFFGSATFGR